VQLRDDAAEHSRRYDDADPNDAGANDPAKYCATATLPRVDFLSSSMLGVMRSISRGNIRDASRPA